MSILAEKLKGKFIVLDGPDGSGKSTQMKMLAEHLAGLGLRVESVYDPGATAVGEKIRAILLDRASGHIAHICETLLFMASRAQLVAERIKPALKDLKVVLCDRFISATLAYQGASGVDANLILDLGETAVQGIWPDLTIILDVPVEVGMTRAGAPRATPAKKKEEPPTLFGDRVESRGQEYHRAVRKNFKALAKLYPHPVEIVSAEAAPAEVFKSVLAAMEKTFLGLE